MDTVSGLHHVTAICSDAQTNLDFYCGVLGLRLVKLTVNFDDPFAYHFYYGDELGRPGTILTFFAWGGAQRARHGSASVEATAFAVPPGALEMWQARLQAQKIPFTTPAPRFGEELIRFEDPDGLVLEIIASERAEAGTAWENGPVDAQFAIRGLHSVTIAAAKAEITAPVLERVLGFQNEAKSENRTRFEVGSGIGSLVDILEAPHTARATTGAGGVHHIAFRVADDATQNRFQDELRRQSFGVSPIMDRSYFHSIYFPSPGGVLFEIATDAPGFTLDETASELGTHLRLPPQFEAARAQIEARMAKIQLPTSQ